MKTALLIWLPLILCGSGVWAQKANPTPADLPPGPPIEKRAPGFSQWLITTTLSGTAALDDQAVAASNDAKTPKAPSATKIMITKTGNIYRVEHLDEARQLWTVFASGATQIMVWPDRHSAAVLAASNNPDAPNPFITNFSVTDFPGFEWVGWGKYSEMKSYKGMKCIVFQKQQPVDSDDPKPGGGYKTVIAYVNVETRLPVALVDADEANILEWKPVPKGVLTLPPSAMAVLQQRQKAEQQMAQHAARPY
jgi:hypothetical protein